MKPNQRIRYSRRYRAELNKFTSLYLEDINRALLVPVKRFAGTLESDGMETARRQLALTFMNTKMGEVLTDLHKDAGVYFANKKYGEIERSVPRVSKAANFGLNDVWIARIEQYLQRYLLSKAVLPIYATTYDFILEVLKKAEQEGWTIERIARELQSDTILLWKARQIAVTELTKADNNSLQMAIDETPYQTNKEWISAHDHRRRHSHREVDGKIIPAKEKFQVNRYRGKKLVGVDFMDGPGDPEASPENVIHCRCTAAIVAATDENDNVILKSNRRAS